MSMPPTDNKGETQSVVTSQPTSASSPPHSPNRKISHDNFAFEHDVKRKTSQVIYFSVYICVDDEQ